MGITENELTCIEAFIEARSLAESTNLGLAGGMAGVLLMQARLYELRRTPQRAGRIFRLVDRLVELVPHQHLGPGLWNGLAGILYAFEFVRRVDADLLGDHGEAIVDFVEEMDGMLCQFMRNAHGRTNFDLISGICGLGAYSLMRTDHAAATTLFRDAETCLLSLAERGTDHYSWKTWSGQRDAHHDLGVAHGIAGVIGLLSLGLRCGRATPRTRQILRHAINWLMGQEDRSLAHSRYSSTVAHAAMPGAPPASSRLAWCYGDLGIAAALAAAACALDDVGLREYWQDLVSSRIAHPESSFHLDSHGLCHGHSGVVHILARLLRHGDPHRAADLHARLHDELVRAPHLADPSAAYGLLEGLAGVLLVLAESNENAVSLRQSWDICLLTAI